MTNETKFSIVKEYTFVCKCGMSHTVFTRFTQEDLENYLKKEVQGE